MDKKIRVVLSPEAKESWDELNQLVAEETGKGITKSLWITKNIIRDLVIKRNSYVRRLLAYIS